MGINVTNVTNEMQNITDTFSKAIPPRLAEVITGGRFSAENVVAVMRKMLTGEGELTGEQELMLSYVCTDQNDMNGICLSTSAEVSNKSESKRDRWRKAKQRQRLRKKEGANEHEAGQDVPVSLDGLSVSPGVALDEPTKQELQAVEGVGVQPQHHDDEGENNQKGEGFASMEELELRRSSQRPTLPMILESARNSHCGITEEFAKQFYDEMQDRGFSYISHGRTVFLNRYNFKSVMKSWWDRRNGSPPKCGAPIGANGRFTSNIPVCY